ncbi:hypothetical protein ACFQ3Z_04490 [Streptomyces nogalater]
MAQDLQEGPVDGLFGGVVRAQDGQGQVVERLLVQDVERLELHGQRERGFGHGPPAVVLADFFGHRSSSLRVQWARCGVRRA